MRGGQSAADRTLLGDRAGTLTRDTVWTLVSSTPIGFRTFHPQGLVKVGDDFIVSSVEVTVPTRRGAAADGHDRDTGAGVGHLFKFDRSGRLLADVKVGEGSMYHPGGLDFDGTAIWLPVSEYRPDSRAILYRVDPVTLRAVEIVRVPDHIGGLVHDTDGNTLHGVSWGSRRFYRWALDAAGRVTDASAPLDTLRVANPSHYVDYQDCKYAGRRRMLCTGVAELRARPDAPAFRLGGLELVSLLDSRPIHQVPVLLWTAGGLDMTHNPAWLEPSPNGLRAYFMPEDDQSTLYLYETPGR